MLRWLSLPVLLWLAWWFGRTLRPGAMPLIERICRVSIDRPSTRLVRYTRGLTALWAAYFVAAAFGVAYAGPSGGVSFARIGGCVWLGSAALFVGEWLVRKLVFPGQVFPGLVRQVRDTCVAWRMGAPGRAPPRAVTRP